MFNPLMMMRTKGLTGRLFSKHAGTPGLSLACGNSGWNPLALFTAGEYGAFYDFTDASTMDAGTALGSSITMIKDKTGNALDLNRSTGTNATWQGNYINLNATSFRTPVGTVAFKNSRFTIATLAKVNAWSASNLEVICRPTLKAGALVSPIRIISGNPITSIITDSLDATVTATCAVNAALNTKYVIATTFDSTGLQISCNGVTGSKVAFPSGSPYAEFTSYYELMQPNNTDNMDLFSGLVFINRVLSSAELSQLTGWLAARG